MEPMARALGSSLDKNYPDSYVHILPVNRKLGLYAPFIAVVGSVADKLMAKGVSVSGVPARTYNLVKPFSGLIRKYVTLFSGGNAVVAGMDPEMKSAVVLDWSRVYPPEMGDSMAVLEEDGQNGGGFSLKAVDRNTENVAEMNERIRKDISGIKEKPENVTTRISVEGVDELAARLKSIPDSTPVEVDYNARDDSLVFIPYTSSPDSVELHDVMGHSRGNLEEVRTFIDAGSLKKVAKVFSESYGTVMTLSMGNDSPAVFTIPVYQVVEMGERREGILTAMFSSTGEPLKSLM